MELKKVEPQIKNRIKEIIDKGIIRSRGLAQLKKEFEGVPAKVLNNFWIEVKQENEIGTEEQAIYKKNNKTTKEDNATVEISSKLKVVKKVATIKGEFETYVKEGTHVKTEKLEFKNADEIEKCKNQLIAEEEAIRDKKKKEADEEFKRKTAEIYARLNEYMNVMLMEV